MRNSWGSSWGEGGYFYLSYYDTRFRPGASFTAESTSNYLGIYNYDFLGWVTSFGYGSNTAWGANIFSANSSNPIEAVGFYVASVNSSYELYIYTGVSTGNPRSGTMVLSQSGTITSPGYHTIALSSPVALSPGTLFSVVVKLTTPGYNYPIPAEMPYAGYSSAATANPNESFISSDGTSWSDLGASSHKANICLKAFTRIPSQGYPISGYVRDALGNGVTFVTLNGLPSSPQTDTDGYYLDQVPLGWSGTATPLNPGYTYTPSSRTYASVNHSYNNQNYLAVSGSCSYSISPLSANYPSVGGLGNISVTAGSSCSWAAISQATWITITSGSSGTGNGTVNYQIATNSSPGLRQGQIIVAGQAFLISQEGSAAAFTPNNFQIIPEVIWAAATGGGTWVTEIQVIDLTGGSQVRASFYYGGGLSRGPFLVWTNSGQAGRTIRFSNFLSRLQTEDSGFNYYGRVGAVTFSTQDTAHRILVTARTVNGDFGKTFPGINPVSSELANVGHEMILTNLASTGTYRSFAGFFNLSAFPVTVSFTLHDSLGNIIGSPFTETFTGNDFKSFNVFVKAGITSSSYSNCWFKIQPTSGSGQLICFGSSANNYSNDTAAHFAFSAGPGYINSPSNNQVIPEVIWASATGGGTWTTEVQVLDQSGGSQVQVFFRYGGGASRGPFLLWTNSGGAGRAARFTNLLASLDGMDPDQTFSYFGRVGAVEFTTQDNDHRIVVTARTVNGNYGKTFPGLNKITSHLAQVGSDMILTNLDKSLSYRSFAGGYNPTSSLLTVEFYLFDGDGNQLGNSFIENFAGYDFKSFNVFQKAGLTEDYSNCFLKIHPLSGSGQLLCYASSANNNSNDTAAHISILR
ncbi:MAG: lectin like domain-containing protein [Candidatus Aminicenantales bacterium]